MENKIKSIRALLSAFESRNEILHEEIKKNEEAMEEMKVLLERHEQMIKTLERDVRELQDIRSELKAMSETLVELEQALGLSSSDRNEATSAFLSNLSSEKIGFLIS